jgi:hypothetical protein
MSGAAAAPAPPWHRFGTAAYFLAGLVALEPALGVLFGAWPPHPTLLAWRHIGSDQLIVAAPMIGAAAVAILLAARLRGDGRVLRLLRVGGLAALVLSVPFTILYAVDSALIYHRLPAQRTAFVAMEARIFTVLAIALALLWMFARAARGISDATSPAADSRGPDGRPAD